VSPRSPGDAGSSRTTHHGERVLFFLILPLRPRTPPSFPQRCRCCSTTASSLIYPKHRRRSNERNCLAACALQPSREQSPAGAHSVLMTLLPRYTASGAQSSTSALASERSKPHGAKFLSAVNWPHYALYLSTRGNEKQCTRLCQRKLYMNTCSATFLDTTCYTTTHTHTHCKLLISLYKQNTFRQLSAVTMSPGMLQHGRNGR